MVAYLWFELRRLARNRIVLVFTILMPVAIYAMAANGGGGGPPIPVEEMEIPASNYRLVALAGLGAIIGSLWTAGAVSEEREAGWLQQLRATPLRPSRVVLAKGVLSMVMPLLTVVTVAVVAWVLDGVSLAVGRWLLTATVLWWGVAPFVRWCRRDPGTARRGPADDAGRTRGPAADGAGHRRGRRDRHRCRGGRRGGAAPPRRGAAGHRDAGRLRPGGRDRPA